MEINHVEGEKRGDILLYAISTCVWCKKTKRFLEQMGVDYYYIDVDLLEEKEKQEIEEVIEKWNPSGSFPTMVINNKKCVIGYNADEIKEKIGL